MVFIDYALVREIFDHGEEYAVDKLSAARGAVAVGDFDIFVHGDRNGYRRIVDELGDGCDHDDDVHKGEALGIPLRRVYKPVDV